MSCSPILDCQLAAIQDQAANALLDQVCTVYELKPVGTGIDERPRGREKFPDDYQAALTDEPCNVVASRISPVEIIQGAQVRYTGSWNISFKAGTAVNEQQIIKVTSLENRVFRLTGPLTASFEVLRIYRAEEVR